MFQIWRRENLQPSKLEMTLKMNAFGEEKTRLRYIIYVYVYIIFRRIVVTSFSVFSHRHVNNYHQPKKISLDDLDYLYLLPIAQKSSYSKKYFI
jgi:hypothetical protein